MTMNPIDTLRRHADARPRDIALIRDREVWRKLCAWAS
jgi:hypothetical protein